MLDEARDLGERLGDIEVQAEAMEWRISALMALGEIPAARGELEIAQRMAQDTRQPFILHVAEHYRSALALLEGRLAEAEDAATRSREWGQLLLGRDASGIYGVQMFGVRREQGRLAELAPVVRVLAGSSVTAARGGRDSRRCSPSSTWTTRPRVSSTGCGATGLRMLREALWLGSLTYLTDAASAVGHRPVAELVYPALVPLAGTNVMIGHGVACYGSSRPLPRDARGHARRTRRCRAPLRVGARARPRDGRTDVARAHRLRVRAPAAARRRRSSRA